MLTTTKKVEMNNVKVVIVYWCCNTLQNYNNKLNRANNSIIFSELFARSL